MSAKISAVLWVEFSCLTFTNSKRGCSSGDPPLLNHNKCWKQSKNNNNLKQELYWIELYVRKQDSIHVDHKQLNDSLSFKIMYTNILLGFFKSV